MTRAGFGCRWLTCLCGAALRLRRGVPIVGCGCGCLWWAVTGELVQGRLPLRTV